MNCPCFDGDTPAADAVNHLADELAEVLAEKANEHKLCPHGVAQWINKSLDSLDPELGEIVRGELLAIIMPKRLN
jgi:hypothetical protein